MRTERSRAPQTKSDWKDPMGFKVWAKMPLFLEDKKPWKLTASFRYLQEALDYLEYAQKQAVLVVFQSPAGCRAISPTDRPINA